MFTGCRCTPCSTDCETAVLTADSLSAPAASDPNLAAGELLADLERRQDEVLVQLEELDRRVTELLRDLGVTLIDDAGNTAPATQNSGGFCKPPQAA